MRIFLQLMLGLVFTLVIGAPLSHANEKKRLSLRLPPPEGYIEVTQKNFPQYIAAVASELYTKNMNPLRFYLLHDEVGNLDTWDVDKLTRSAVLYGIRANIQDSPGVWMHPLLQQPAPPVSRSELDVSLIEAWLTKEPGEREGLLAFGPLAATDAYSVRLFVGDRTTDASLGLLAPGPIAEAQIFCLVQEQPFIFSFISLLGTAQDAAATAEQATAFARDLQHWSLDENAQPLADTGAVFALLHMAAVEWAEQGKVEKSIAAYERMIAYWNSFDAGIWKSVSLMNELGLVLLASGRHAEAQKILESAIAKGARISGETSYVRQQAQMLLGRLRVITGDYERAKEILLALPFDTLPVPVRKEAYYMLLRASIGLAEFDEGVRFGRRALEDFHESRADEEEAVYLYYLAKSYMGAKKMPTATFFLMLSLVAAEKELASGGMQLEEVDTVTSALKDILEMTHRRAGGLKENPPHASPASVARQVMNEQEQALFIRYGEVSTALRQAAEAAIEEITVTARNIFHAWLQDVELTFAE